MSFTFIVGGDPVAYYIGSRDYKIGKEQRRRLKKYHAYQSKVRLYAKHKGLELPLHATEDQPVHIETWSYFKDRRHPDPENVHKGIVDALFYRAKGGDKYCAGTFQYPHYDGKRPRVIVTVTFINQEIVRKTNAKKSPRKKAAKKN